MSTHPITALPDLAQHRGRVALVTGAGSGIGRCVAEGLALAHGARVYVLDKDEQAAAAVVQGINESGGHAKTLLVDLADGPGLHQALPSLTTAFSGLRAGTGRMAYGTSKAALIAMTRQFAIEVAEWGITVNAIAPGPVDTPLAQANHSDATRAAYGDMVPMRRYGTAEEIANGVLFLASDQASYVTGQTLAIDGGFVAAGVLVRDLFTKAPVVPQRPEAATTTR